ncbi:Histone deacetylase clr3 [Taphrina deformans PYCC 5710]|uniref:Histone deacetylase n=1 Tax=Taphrina deformans (strain PYCC 5710 / ATCC 11124 / CBS 356.35 / IMI 108563 / JCM 9778 / NBRC 8474) TaxID=1097556 RepID=R4X6N0_TAPDE|nr:Histone deacetylase clr3 [Taphrina deformans PYCC 5710]|eukprot:CCG80536.1 Histone deacetylase clr3 [Taphrina deformans PYCC 5710]
MQSTDEIMPDIVQGESSLNGQPTQLTSTTDQVVLEALSGPILPTSQSIQEVSQEMKDTKMSANLESERSRILEPTQLSGLCYDARMRFHAVANPIDDHPEDPRRIYHIYRAIEQAGLTSISALTVEGQRPLRRIPAREILQEEVLLVHSVSHWESMLATANMTYDQLIKLGTISDSMYFNNESAYCARLACGGAVETCKAVVTGRVKNAIAVIRPPGHHAEPDFASGFCMFNNVAVAVRTTMRDFPAVKRVLVLDWDVHHGNGTQTAFLRDPNVLFISLHRYENGTFYPGTTYGNLDQCGEDEGLGRNINIPWPTAGMGDSDYLHAFEKAVIPIAREFDPDLVIISAGFDAAAGDPIGECFVTPSGYAHMTHQLMELAEGKCVTVLEGGYNLVSISDSALAVTKTMMGQSPPRLPRVDPSPRAIETVQRVCLEQSKYWRCMAPMAYHQKPLYASATRLHDVVRTYQAQELHRKHKMVILPLLEDRASASFVNQALSTPDFHTTDKLMFCIHDAPAVLSNLQPLGAQMSLHESYMPDSVTRLIDWAATNKYGIIDVNIPANLSGVDSSQSYNVIDETARLAKYIWDNYLELTDATHIILVAVGESCSGLVNMISVKDVTRRVSAVINFYGRHPLRALTSTEDSLVDWYYNNSLCFTTSNNEAWTIPKRPKRKYGKAIKADCLDIDELIHVSFDRVVAFIDDATES